MSKGKFIVIEGMEGAGKSSAIKIITGVLSHFDIAYQQTREPGGTPLAEELRNLVKSADHHEMVTQETELLLMYASRSQLLCNVIRPALDKGEWVVGDRHDLSSRAYQGGGRQIDESTIEAIAQVTLNGFKPDLTIYLDIDPKIGLSRAKARGELDRIEQEQFDFFERVHKKYQELASQDESIKSIDASQSMEKVHHDIEAIITQFCLANK